MDSQWLTAWQQLPLESHVSNQLALLERECTHMCKIHAHIRTHTCTHKPCSLKIARPQCSVRSCLPAATMDCLFDYFRVLREKLLWWLRTSVWSLCEHSGCLSCGNHQLGCHSCRDIWSGNQSPFCTVFTHEYTLLQRQNTSLSLGACEFGFERNSRFLSNIVTYADKVVLKVFVALTGPYTAFYSVLHR